LIGIQSEQIVRAPRSRKLAIMALVCLALLLLLTVVQTVHMHPRQVDADHCPLCIVLHATAPIAVAAAVILLVAVRAPAPLADQRRAVRLWFTYLFTRPPPVAC
jgi:hypothetical protein